MNVVLRASAEITRAEKPRKPTPWSFWECRNSPPLKRTELCAERNVSGTSKRSKFAAKSTDGTSNPREATSVHTRILCSLASRPGNDNQSNRTAAYARVWTKRTLLSSQARCMQRAGVHKTPCLESAECPKSLRLPHEYTVYWPLSQLTRLYAWLICPWRQMDFMPMCLN